MNKRIVIIGAGPAGLGAAWGLQEAGYKNWQIFEKNNYVGGLASSFKDSKGFTWDIGGHVIFSHYDYFDHLLDKILGEEYLKHERKAFIRIKDRWVPYPFQNNIRYLPKNKLIECLLGLITARVKRKKINNFKEWIVASFGSGIAKYFMLPQNFKTWVYPLEEMSFDWVSERISAINLKKIIPDIIFYRDDVSWGKNKSFKFPLSGGTGDIFRRFIPYIQDKLFLNKEMERVDVDKKEITFTDGEKLDYDLLINTSPLDKFINKARLKEFYAAAKELKHNSVFVVGVGVKKEPPSDKCWMYFPESNSPFYRATYFSNYSTNNVPRGGYYSLMCETAYSEYSIRNKESIINDTIQGLINSGLLSKKNMEHIVSKYLIDAEYAYPIPVKNRDKALGQILPNLLKKGIYSVGRFGAWKYEHSSMGHCFMQGRSAADGILMT